MDVSIISNNSSFFLFCAPKPRTRLWSWCSGSWGHWPVPTNPVRLPNVDSSSNKFTNTIQAQILMYRSNVNYDLVSKFSICNTTILIDQRPHLVIEIHRTTSNRPWKPVGWCEWGIAKLEEQYGCESLPMTPQQLTIPRALFKGTYLLIGRPQGLTSDEKYLNHVC